MNSNTIVIIVMVILLIGVITIHNKYYSAASRDKVYQTMSTGKIVDYSHGVYYFPYTESAYANALSKFIDEHPDLRLVSQAGDGTGAYGADNGYFVVFEPRIQKE